jgi:hypothetical protein
MAVGMGVAVAELGVAFGHTTALLRVQHKPHAGKNNCRLLSMNVINNATIHH